MKKFISVCSITTLLLLISVPIGSFISVKIFSDVPDYMIENDKFNERKLILYLKELRIKFPHIVMAQAIVESGCYSSVLFKKNNNLFGMRNPGVRTTTSKGSRFGYAYYNSWRESVLDYALFSAYNSKNFSSENEYFEFLDKIYAEDNYYVTVLKTTIKKNKLKNLF